MSYIESFKHELVGIFAGIPLYHPLEVIVGTSVPSEFSSSPRQLVLGGGPGEHLAMLLTNPGGALVYFADRWLKTMCDRSLLAPSGVTLQDLQDRVLEAIPPINECLAFPGWDIEMFVEFYGRCTSPAFVTPFVRETFGLIESWILDSLGEFVYFGMTDLAESVIAGFPHLNSLIKDPILYNVTIPVVGRRTHKVRA